MKERKNASLMWCYFKKNDPGRAVCKVCKAIISYKTSIANLKCHLRRRHPSVFSTLVSTGKPDVNQFSTESDQSLHSDEVISEGESNNVDIVPASETSIASNSPLQISSSAVWEYFEKSEPGIAVCIICRVSISYKSTNANLKSHLRRKHISLYSSLESSNKPFGNFFNQVLSQPDENLLSNEAISEEVCNIVDIESSPGESVVNYQTHPRVSKLWNYFKKTSEPGIAVCNICNGRISCKSTITNLKGHLRRKHPSVLSSLVSPNKLVPNQISFQCNQSLSSDEIIVENVCSIADTEPSPGTSFTTSHQVRSNASVFWNYFDKSDEPGVAICIICKTTVSYKSTTANLKSHLKRKHQALFFSLVSSKPILYQISSKNDQHLPYDEIIPEEVDKIVDTKTPSSGTNVASYSPIAKCFTESNLVKQNVVEASFHKKHSNEQTKQINSDLLDIFIDGLHPFYLIEERSFKKLMRWIPGYRLPDKNTISGFMLEDLYAKTIENVKMQISNNVESICITTDMWDCRLTQSYVAITGHYLSPSNIELKTVLLGCCQFQDNKTAENMGMEIKGLIEQWDLQNKVNFAVSVNNSVIMKAIDELLRWKHCNCYIQTLNLLLEEVILLFKESIDKVKKIVFYIRNDTVTSEKFLNYQLQQGKSPKKLKQQVDLQWNSTFLMLNRFVELQEAVKATLSTVEDDLLTTISDEEWTSFSQLCVALKPFEEFLILMNGEKYLTGGTVLVITRCLKESCNKMLTMEKLTPVIHSIVLSLQHELCERFKNMEQNETFSLCTFMDPRFKMQGFSDKDEAKKTKNIITNLVADFINQENQSEENMMSSEVVKKPDELNPWIIFDEIVGEKKEPATPLSKAVKEVDMYLADDLLPRQNKQGDWNCPFQWWKNHRYVYPNLTKLFIQKCNIVASSVPCKQIFSKMGKILSQRRTSLTGEEVEKLMFLNINLNEDRFKHFI